MSRQRSSKRSTILVLLQFSRPDCDRAPSPRQGQGRRSRRRDALTLPTREGACWRGRGGFRRSSLPLVQGKGHQVSSPRPKRASGGQGADAVACQKHNVLPVGGPLLVSDRSTMFVSLFKPFASAGVGHGRNVTVTSGSHEPATLDCCVTDCPDAPWTDADRRVWHYRVTLGWVNDRAFGARWLQRILALDRHNPLCNILSMFFDCVTP